MRAHRNLLALMVFTTLCCGEVGAQIGEPLTAQSAFLAKRYPTTRVWFWNACRTPDDFVYLLVVAHGSDAAALLTLNRSTDVVVNGADLRLNGRSAEVEETMGGLWTMARTRGVAEFLMAKAFMATSEFPSHAELRRAIQCPKHDEGKYGPFPPK